MPRPSTLPPIDSRQYRHLCWRIRLLRDNTRYERAPSGGFVPCMQALARALEVFCNDTVLRGLQLELH